MSPFSTNTESPFKNLWPMDGRAMGGGLNIQEMAKGLKGGSGGWTIHEAYLGLLLAVAMSDNAYPEAEQNEILRLGKRSPILSQLSMPELAKANNNVNERFKSRPEAVRECCETIPEEMRLAVLGHCVEIAIADGGMSQPEAAMIERILEHLRVDMRDAKNVIEVVLLLARY